jgi:hypothetical protein
MVPFEREVEAHFVCGCLNSIHSQMIVVGSIVLHPDTHVLKRVSVPKYDPKNALHDEVASLSRLCHEAALSVQHDDIPRLQSKLDATCGQIWSVPTRQTKMIRNCLKQVLGSE